MAAVAPGKPLRLRAFGLIVAACVVVLAASVVRGSTAAGAGHVTLQGTLTLTRGHEDAAVASGTITVMPDGVTCPPDCTFTYEEGESKTLTANPSAGSFFFRWQHDTEPSTCAASNFEATCSLRLTGAATKVVAVFLPDPTLAVGVTGNVIDENTKASVDVSAGGPCVTGEDGLDACFYPVALGDTVTLKPINTPAGSLVSWSVPECPGTGECTIVVDSQLRSVVGTFSPLHLNVLIEGTGTVTGGPINCPDVCGADFPTFTEVTLTASSPGFLGWNGACLEAGTSPSCTIRLSGGDVVGAWFAGSAVPPLIVPPRIPVPLQVRKTGDGAGTVTSARSRFSETIDCGSGTGCDAFFQQGETAALVADPAAGSAFAGWTTPGGLCSTNLNCRFEVMRVSRLEAKFVRNAQPPPPPVTAVTADGHGPRRRAPSARSAGRAPTVSTAAPAAMPSSAGEATTGSVV